MDSEMIERCKDVLDQKFNHWTDEMLNDIVICVIKAMREPTDKMLGVDAPDMPAGGDAGDIWRSMIDVVIND